MNFYDQQRENRLSRERRERRISYLIYGIIGLAVVLVTVLVGFAYYGSQRTETCVVNSKDRGVSFTTDSNGHSQSKTDYRAYTSCGTFNVKDEFWLFKFNSADTYGSLQDGKRYQLQVIGFRNGFFSVFPNIVSATPVG